MDLKITRSILNAIHSGDLEKVETQDLPIFGLHVPKTCQGVDPQMLWPKNTWSNKEHYDQSLERLAREFVENFKKYESGASKETKAAGPKLNN